MIVIDCHANIGWDVNNTRKNQYPVGQTYRALIEKMNVASIRQAVVVPFPSPGGQFSETEPWYELENNYLFNAHEFSKRLIPFPAVNPTDINSVENIKNVASLYQVKGVKFSHQIPMHFSIDKLIGHPLMKIIEDNALSMMIHIGTGKESGASKTDGTLPAALEVVKKYPNVNFILCHLGRLHERLIEALNCDNVFTDTAGLGLLPNWNQFLAKNPLKVMVGLPPQGVIEHLVDLGYADKILFGSDEPYTHYRAQLSHITESSINNVAKRAILAENVVKLL